MNNDEVVLNYNSIKVLKVLQLQRKMVQAMLTSL